jgi:hypothetical protein
VAEQAADHATHNLRSQAQHEVAGGHVDFPARLLWLSALGLLGALVLSAFHLGLVTLAESWAHALDLFREDAALVVPIILGFGTQVGLFTYLKRALHGTGAAGTVTGTSGGASTLGMLACSAHHVTDVLPLVGLSGATVFLAQYKVPFIVVGLLSNAAGIAVLMITIRRVQRWPGYLGHRPVHPGHTCRGPGSPHSPCAAIPPAGAIATEERRTTGSYQG